MVILKVIHNVNGGVEYLENCANYVGDDRSIVHIGNGVDPTDPNAAFEQMLTVKKYYGKVNNNPLVHIVVSFDKSVRTYMEAVKLSIIIAAFFNNTNQYHMGVHCADRYNSWFHAHIDLNSVSYIDGKLMQTYIKELQPFINHCYNATNDEIKVVFY